jgi:hypothetical protein
MTLYIFFIDIFSHIAMRITDEDIDHRHSNCLHGAAFFRTWWFYSSGPDPRQHYPCPCRENGIDEVLTPDSSRFWPVDKYEPGKSQPSFDKQYLRDYLSSLDWNKTPPPPPLPEEIVEKTRLRYEESVQRITGKG